MLILGLVLLFAQGIPACDTREHRQMDFRVGEWDVTSGSKPVGRSIVQKELNGCLIVDNWYGDDGDRGKSLNWFEPSMNKWRRVYVGLTGSVDYTGEWRDGALRFESKTPLRLTFTPVPNNKVRRHEERLEGQARATVHDFEYKPEAARVQETSSKPGCATAESRQFDFWAGHWNVYNPEKQLAGTNRVDKAVNGCLLIENWSGAKGSSGKSFNFYDTARKKWRQVWVSKEGSLDLEGDFIDGAMRYTGETTGLSGVSQESLVFTPNTDGTVRQLWRQSPDGGNTWRVVFEGLYLSYGKSGP